ARRVPAPSTSGGGRCGVVVSSTASAAYVGPRLFFPRFIDAVLVAIGTVLGASRGVRGTRHNSIWQPAEAGFPPMSERASVIGNTVTFVILFVILMALTYAPLYPFDASSKVVSYVVIAVQLAAWALLIGITFAHGIMINRGLLLVLPLLGMVFNLLVPLLTTYLGLVPETHTMSWWLIATVLNLACIYLVVTSDQRRVATAS